VCLLYQNFDFCASIFRISNKLTTLSDKLLGEERGERWFEADTYWTKGELLGQLGEDAEMVAECYRKAIEVAREQEARFLEQRALESLKQLR